MPGWLAALPVTAAVALAALVQSAVAVIPPWDWAVVPVVPVVAVGFALLCGAVARLTATPAFARWQLPVEPAAAGQRDTPVLVGGGGASPR
ncbi:hypothetical protein [Modestobacter excelsi]|uniref:hypothetical protein n=1 Tax=Modestobacter excelsi TaxID=2213161 RepID=UPI001FE45A6B|nr:hypothetical protein [Modestobacter excelsi]